MWTGGERGFGGHGDGSEEQRSDDSDADADIDDEADTVTFQWPDHRLEIKTVRWCKDNGAVKRRDGVWH